MGKSMIGLAMRVYRNSPLHPRLGQSLAALLAKVSSRRGIVRRNVGGFTFDLDLAEVIDSSLYFSGTFEERSERIIEQLVKPGMTAIDVGANFGYHTFRMAKAAGPDGRVLAIEPTTWAFRRLEQHRQINPIGNVELLQAGLSDADQGHVRAHFQSSYRLDGKDSQLEETITLRSLDSIVAERGLQKIGFMKIDVDGYEVKVLRGAAKTLAAWRPNLLLEVNPRLADSSGDDWREALRGLLRLGYLMHDDRMSLISDPCEYCAGLPGGLGTNLVALQGPRGDR
jgi:FkbM family methyltransferase